MKKPVLMVVIPVYNEERVLPLTAPRFLQVLERMVGEGMIDPSSRVLFVNDGSRDTTWSLICGLAKQDERFSGISLSRNRGHQNALLAGLMYARERCDITVSIDCDGQDDEGAMVEMVRKYLEEGCEVVYGVRRARDTDTVFKRATAQGFYKVMQALGAETVYNHADYRLLSRRALDGLAEFPEVNLYLRGIVPLVGYKSDTVYYDRDRRLAGESHYPLRKMLALAGNGITSLSEKPIALIGSLGGLCLGGGLIALLVQLILSLCGHSIAGWGWVLSAMVTLCGLQLVAIGVVGAYVGRIYMETKHRPRYIIAETTEDAESGEK